MARRVCKICSPFVPGLGLAGQAIDSGPGPSEQAASQERVDNLRIRPLGAAERALLRGGLGQPRAAVERMKLWENGRTLRVKFLDGLPEVQAKVAAIAKEWGGPGQPDAAVRHQRRGADPHQLCAAGLLVVHRGHRRRPGVGQPRHHELWLAGAGHRAA